MELNTKPPATGEVKKFDIIEASIKHGLSLEQIVRAGNPNLKATIKDPVTLYREYGSVFKSPEEFNEFYTQMADMADVYNQTKAEIPLVDKQVPYWHMAKKSPQRVFSSKLEGYTGSGVIGSPLMWSVSQIARDKGFYITEGPDGKDVRMPVDVGMLRNPANNFIVDGIQNGEPYLRLKPGSQYNPQDLRYSVWGDNDKYGMSIVEPLFNFMQEFVISAAELIPFAGKFGANIDKSMGVEDSPWADYALNFLGRLKNSSSEQIKHDGWLGSGSSFFYNLGGGLGLLMPQRWAGKLAAEVIKRSAKKLVKEAVPAPGRVIKELEEEGLEYVEKKAAKESVDNADVVTEMWGRTGQQIKSAPKNLSEYNLMLGKQMKTAAWKSTVFVGTMQAVKGFYDESISAGLSERDATLLSVLALPAVALTEWMLSAKFLTRGIGADNYAPKLFTFLGEPSNVKMFKGYLKEVLPKELKKVGNKVDSDEVRLSILKKVLGGAYRNMKKVSLLPIVGGAGGEGTQEFSEEVFYVGLERMYNAGYFDDILPNKTGHFHGVDNWKQLYPRLRDNFIAGAILGGIMDAGIGNFKAKKQEDLINSMIMNNQLDELADIVKYSYKHKQFGLDHLDSNGNQIFEGQPGTGVVVNKDGSLDKFGFERDKELKTLNDLNAYNFIQKIQLAYDAYNAGVVNLENVKKYSEDPSIINEVFDLSRTINTLNKEVNDLNVLLEEERKKSGPNVEVLENQIKAKNDQLKIAKDQFVDATVPTEPDQYGNKRYTKRANQKLAEIIFSEIRNKKVTYPEIKAMVDNLEAFKKWKQEKWDQYQAIKEAQTTVTDKIAGLNVPNEFTELTDLMTSLNTMDEAGLSNAKESINTIMSKMPNALKGVFDSLNEIVDIQNNTKTNFNLGKLGEASDKLKNLQESILNLLVSDRGMIKDIVTKDIGENTTEDVINSQIEALLAVPELALDEIRSHVKADPKKQLSSKLLTLFDFIDNELKSEIENPDVPSEFTDDVLRELEFEYFTTIKNGVDPRQKLIELNNEFENMPPEIIKATLDEVENGINEKLQFIEDTEIINESNVTANRDLFGLSKNGLEANTGKVIFGTEVGREAIVPSSMLMGELKEDEFLNYYTDQNGAIAVEKDDEGKPKVYKGISKLRQELSGINESRDAREKNRQRNMLKRHSQKLMALTIYSNAIPTDIVSKIKELQRKTHDNPITDENIVSLEKEAFTIMQEIHESFKDPESAQAFARTILRGKISPILYKYRNSGLIHYPIYNRMRDNNHVSVDKLLEMDFSNIEGLFEKILNAENQNDLPEGVDYKNKDVRSSIIISYVVEMHNFVNELINLDYASFYENLNKIKTKRDFIEGTQQEEAMRFAYAMITGEHKFITTRQQITGLPKEDYDKLNQIDPVSDPEQIWNQENFHLNGVFVRGINGGGKTTVISRGLALLLNEHHAIRKANVLLVSPNNKLGELLKKQFEDCENLRVQVMTADQFSNEVKNNTFHLFSHDYVFYDEASRFPYQHVVSFLNQDAAVPSKYVFLGDPTQSSDGQMDDENTDLPISFLVPRTNPISEVFRSEIYDIARITNELTENVLGFKTNASKIKFPNNTKYTKGNKSGVRFAKNATDVIANWEADSAIEDGVERVLVFADYHSQQEYLKKATLSIAQKSKVRFINASEEVTNAQRELAGGTIQGSEVEAVYVAFEMGTKPGELKNFKTAIGRAVKFVMLPHETNVSHETDKLNETNQDKDGLIALTNKRKERLEVLSKIDRSSRIVDDNVFAEEQEKDEQKKTNDRRGFYMRAPFGEEFISSSVLFDADTPTHVSPIQEFDSAGNTMLNKLVEKIAKKYNPVKNLNSFLDLLQHNMKISSKAMMTNGVYDPKKAYKEIGLKMAYLFNVRITGTIKDNISGLGTVTAQKFLKAALGVDIILNQENADQKTAEEIANTINTLIANHIENLRLKISDFYRAAAVPTVVNEPNKKSTDTTVTRSQSISFVETKEDPEEAVDLQDMDSVMRSIEKTAYTNGNPRSVLRYSTASRLTLSKTGEHFDREFYENIAKIKDRLAENGNEGKLVYHKKLVLSTTKRGSKNGSKPTMETHYDVIEVQDTNGNHVGVLYQPYSDAKDLKDNFGSKSLKSSNQYGKSNWSDPIVREYMDTLAELINYGRALTSEQNSNSIQIGDVFDNQILSPLPFIDYKNPIKVEGFITRMLEKGFYFQVFDSAGQRKMSNDLETILSNLVIVQTNKTFISNNKKQTTIRPFIYASLTPDVDVNNDHGNDLVRIEINGSKIKEQKHIVSEIDKMVASITKEFEKVSNKLSYDQAVGALNYIIYQKGLDSFIQFNRNLLYEANLVEMNDKSFYDITKPPTNMNVAEIKKYYEKAIQKVQQTLNENGYVNHPVRFVSDTPMITLTKMELGTFTTPVQDLRAPEATIMYGLKLYQEPGNNTSNNAQRPKADPFSNALSFEMASAAIAQKEFQSVGTAKNVLSTIFGEDFINNRLEITPNKRILGRNAYGAVAEFRMILYNGPKGVLKGAPWHEASHYALRHFVSPKSFVQILESTKGKMREDGINGVIDNDSANEYLSELARTNAPDTAQKRSLWKVFTDWLQDLISWIKATPTTHERFLYKLYTGQFNGKKEIANNTTGVHRMESNDPEDELDIEEDVLDDSLYTHIQLAAIFGGKNQYYHMLRNITKNINEETAYHNDLNSTATDSLPEAIVKVYDMYKSMITWTPKFTNVNSPIGLSDMEARQYRIEKVTDPKIWTSISKKIYPSANITSKQVEDTVSRQFDQDSIDASKKNVTQTLRTFVSSLNYYSVEKKGARAKLKEGFANGKVLVKQKGFNLYLTPQHNKYINWNILNEAFIEASQNMVGFLPGKGKNSYVKRLLYEMQEIANNLSTINGENEYANTIYSFLYSISDLQNGSLEQNIIMHNNPQDSTKIVSYIHLSDNFNEIVKHLIKNPNATPEEILQAMNDNEEVNRAFKRSEAASELLNGISSYATSITKNDMHVVEYTGKYFRLKFRSSLSPEINKTNYKHAIESAIYSNGNIKPYVAGTIGRYSDKSGYQIQLKKVGDQVEIYFGRFKNPILRSNPDGTFEFVTDPPTTEAYSVEHRQLIDNVHDMFGFFNMHSVNLRNKNIIDSILRTVPDENTAVERSSKVKNTVDDTVADSQEINRNELATFFGQAFTILYVDKMSNLDKSSKEQTDEFESALQKIAQQLVKKYQPRMSKDGVADPDEIQDIKRRLENKAYENESEAESLRKILKSEKIKSVKDLDTLLFKMGVVEARVTGQISNSFAKNAIGKKVYLNTTKTRLQRVFAPTRKKGLSAKGVEELLALPENNFELYQKETFRMSNRFFKLTDIYETGGIQYDYGSKTNNQFNANDNINNDFFGIFLSKLFRSSETSGQVFDVVINNPADSSKRVVLSITLDNVKHGVKLIDSEITGNKEVYYMPLRGQALLHTILDNKMDTAFRCHQLSLQRLSLLRTMTQANTKVYDKVIFDINKLTYSKKAFTDPAVFVSEYEKIMKHIVAGFQEINNSINNDPGRLKKAVQLFVKAGMTQNIDFVISENRIIPGNDVVFDQDDIYNMNTFQRWKEKIQDYSGELRGILHGDNISKKSQEKIEDVQYFMNSLFWDRYSAMQEMFSVRQVSAPENIHKGWKGEGWKYKVDTGKWIFNPFYSSFMYMYHFANHSARMWTMGPTSQSKDPIVEGKYNKQAVQQGNIPQVSESGVGFGLSHRSNVIKIQDNESISTHAALFGVNKTTVHTDGAKYFTLIHWLRYSHSLGGRMGLAKPTDRTAKTHRQSVDYSNGIGEQAKSATFVWGEDFYRHNKEDFMNLHKHLLNRPTQVYDVNDQVIFEYNPWDEFQKQLEIDNDVEKALERTYYQAVKVSMAYGTDVLQNTISGIEMISTHKQRSTGENVMTMDEYYDDLKNASTMEDYVVSSVKNEDEVLILNVNQTKGVNKVTNPVQLDEIVGDTTLDTLNAIITLNALRELKGKIKSFGSPYKFIHHILERSLDSRDQLTFLHGLYSKGLSNDIPIIERTSSPILSMAFKNTITKKRFGRKMVQAPAEKQIMYYDAVDSMGNSVVVTDYDLEKYPGVYTVTGEKRNMKYTSFKDSAGNDVSEQLRLQYPEFDNWTKIVTKNIKEISKKQAILNSTTQVSKRNKLIEEINSLVDKTKPVYDALQSARKEYISEIAKIEVAEAAMPFLYYDQLGIDESQKYSLAEIFMLKGQDGKYIDIRAFVKANSKDYYKSRYDGIAALVEWIASNNIDTDSVMYKSVKTLRQKNIEKLQSEVERLKKLAPGKIKGYQDILNRIAELEQKIALKQKYEPELLDYTSWIDGLINSLFINFVRIPTSYWGSANVAEIASITFDPSSVYLSHEKNAFDDADFDIDQLSVYLRNIEYNHEIGYVDSKRFDDFESAFERIKSLYQDYDIKVIENLKFDHIFNKYTSLEYLDEVMQTLDVADLKMRSETANQEFKGRYFNDYTTSIKNFLNSIEGKMMVSRAANAIHAYSTLHHMTKGDREMYAPGLNLPLSGAILTETEIGERVEFILTTLGEYLQLSVDNVKHMVAGLLNVNLVTSNVLIGLALKGVTRNEIYDILDNQEIRDMVRKVSIQQSVGEKHENLMQAIQDEIAKMNIGNNDVAFETRIKEHKQQLINNIKELEAKIGEFANTDEAIIHPGELSNMNKGSMKDITLGVIKETPYKLDAVLQAKKAHLEEMNKLPIEDQVETEKQIYQERLALLNRVYDATIVGEWLRRFSVIISLYNDMPSSDYDLYNLVEQIEEYTLQEITDIPVDVQNGRNILPDASEVKSGTVRTLEYYASFKEGYRGMQQNNPLARVNQQQANATITKMYADVMKLVEEAEITVSNISRPIRELVTIYGLSKGNTGIDEAGIAAVTSYGHGVGVIMPNNFMYRDKNGVDIKTLDKEQTMQRFSYLPDENRIKISIAQLSELTDNEFLLKNANRYFATNIHVAQRADFSIIISSNSSTSGQAELITKQNALGKSVEIEGNQLGESKYQETVNNIAQKIIDQIKANFKEKWSNMSNADITLYDIDKMDNKFRINITGNTIDLLEKTRGTEAEMYLEREKKIREIGNLTSIIRGNPNLNMVYNVLKELYQMKQESFLMTSKKAFQLYNYVANLTGQPRLSSPTAFYKAQDAINNAVHYYFIQNHTKPIFDFTQYGDFRKRSEMALVEQDNITYSELKKLNLNEKGGTNAYMKLFPSWAMNLINAFPENEFIKSLSVSAYNTLFVKSTFDESPENIELLQRSFLDLPTEVRKMFGYYVLLTTGFVNSGFSMAKYMSSSSTENSPEVLEELSEAYEQFKKELEDPTSDVWEGFVKGRLARNLIAQNRALVRHQSDKKYRAGFRPEYTQARLSYEMYGEKYRKDYPSLIRKREMSLDESDNPTDWENAYDPIFNVLPGMAKITPYDRSIETTAQIAHLTDSDEVIDWLIKGEVTKQYRLTHGYKNTVSSDLNTLARVDESLAKVTVIDSRTVKFQKMKDADLLAMMELHYKWKESMKSQGINTDSKERVDLSRPIADNKRMSKNGLKKLIEVLQRRNPGFSFNIVNNKTTQNPGVKGYVMGTKVYLNEDLVTQDTPLHEMMHPIFVAMLRSSNENTQRVALEILSAAVLERMNNTDLYKEVKRHYPQFSDMDLDIEVAVTMLGFVSEDKVMRVINDHTSTWERLRDFVSGIWTKIGNIITSLFSKTNMQHDADYSDEFLNVPVQLKRSSVKLNTSSTFLDVANHLIDMVIEGKMNGLLSQEELESIAMMNRFNESRNLGQPIKKVSDNIGELLLGENLQNIDYLIVERQLNDLYNRMLGKGELALSVGFNQVDFTQEFKIADEELRMKKVKEKIKTEFLPLLKEQSDNFMSSVVKVMKTPNMTYQQVEKEFTISKGDRKLVMMSPKNMSRILHFIEINPKLGGNIYRYSELASMTSTHPELATALTEEFKGSDPYIVIHDIQKDAKTGKPIYDISILDFNVGALTFRGRGLSKNALLTDNFVTTPTAKSYGVNYPATLKSVHKYNIGLIAMNLKRSLPQNMVKIRRMGVLEIVPFAGKIGERGIVSFGPTNMEDVIPVVRALSESDYMQQVSKPIADLMKDKAATKIEAYYPDYIDQVMSWWNDKLEEYEGNENISSGVKENLKEGIQEINDFINDPTSDPKNLLEIIEKRKQYIVHKNSLTDESSRMSNTELRLLAHLSFELQSYVKNQQMSDHNVWQTYMKTQFDLRNPVLQNYTARQGVVFAKISDLFKEFNEVLDEKTMELIEDTADKPSLLRRLFTDPSNSYFERLFKTKVIDGKEVKIHRLHWTTNDPDTAAALARGTITKKDLEYSNYILDQVEIFMKRLIRQTNIKNASFVNDDGILDMGLVNERTDTMFNSNWSRGLLPVMHNSVTQMLGNRNQIGMAFRKIMNQNAYHQDMYEEMITLNDETDSIDTIRSLFYNQIANAVDSQYGGEGRLEMLGLEYNEGQLTVKDQAINDSATYNIYTIMRYLAMDTIRKENIENELLPLFNDAKLILQSEQLFKKKKMTQALKYLEESKAKHIVGRHTIAAKEEQGIEHITGAIRMALRATSLAGVAWNLSVGITSLTANLYESSSNAIANTLGGNPYRMATPLDKIKAVKEVLSNFKKVVALEKIYQVIEQDTYELLNNQANDVTRQHIYNDNFTHLLNRQTDLFTRRVEFVAQMIHDGTYDAHDDEGNYDPTKDDRFKGKDSDELKNAHYNYLLDDLKRDGVPGQDKSDVPLRAYSYKEQVKLRMVGTEFAVGVFDKEGKSLGDNHLWYQVIFQFKNFINAMLETRLGQSFQSLEGGEYKYYKDEMNRIIREWQPLRREGAWVTANHFVGTGLLANIPFVEKLMESINFTVQKRTLEDWKNMTDLERRNLWKSAMDAITGLTIYFLAKLYDNAVFGDMDPEQKKYLQRNFRLIRAIEKGFLTSVVVGPASLADMATNVALVRNVQRLLKILTFKDPIKEAGYLVPFGSSARMISDYVTE